MKKYDAYKDSGVKWIGEIPNHWEAHPTLICSIPLTDQHIEPCLCACPSSLKSSGKNQEKGPGQPCEYHRKPHFLSHHLSQNTAQNPCTRHQSAYRQHRHLPFPALSYDKKSASRQKKCQKCDPYDIFVSVLIPVRIKYLNRNLFFFISHSLF